MPSGRQEPGPSKRAPPRLLVLGVGNALAGDDGIGPAALALLQRTYAAPPEARLEDGGTRGLALLPLLEEARHVLLIDAVHGQGPPGSLVRLEPDQIAERRAPATTGHEMGVADLLALSRLSGCEPDRLVLLGIVPAQIAPFSDLSPEVTSALPTLVDEVVREAAAMGHPFTPRDQK